ncbi:MULTISPECIES: hypothetical protein [unclassified Lysobacter]|uniref:hypothetical protein n=1 Tax=unclassified Lysobacter TaxID=2635362 RepID=UPI0006FB20D0|nr:MULTISPECIES: hypothetical protein [unclassified Lysobacter]KQZ60102.1 hypothetical protein ASD53_02785 [Lysobacter sp. Root559]KRC38545.1 hypothetical protein ASE10_03110 [Lysobacter sp. Root76]KRD71258.1 hypothetical protein ASE45_05370 [Lysobacter sp. Root96]
MSEEIVTQMGLLLTQIRGVRSTLDQVAQATARYAGFAFAEAFTPGGRFGAPPMRGGALLVHVNNLRDLVASSGIAGFFEGLLGGIGRFFGGLFGGLIGGTIAGVALPVMIWKVDSIVTTLRNILDRLGIGGATPAQPGATREPEDSPTASVAGQSLTDQIGEFREILSLITGLFEASGNGSPAPERLESSVTPQHERWMSMLRSVENVVGGVTQIVKGLIILVPMLIGSLALLIDKLDSIKLAFVEMIQFILRNVMLLRGVVLVTVFDLLGVAARLAAGLVQVVGQMVQGLLTSLFDIAGTVLQGALAVFQFLAGGLQRVVNGMLRWLVDTLFVVLARFGDLRIFRLITHLIQVLPAVLPPLYELIRGSSPPLTATQQTALDNAAALALPGPAFPSGALPSSLLPAMPDVADLAMPASALATLRTQMDSLRDGLVRGVGDLSNSVATGFAQLSARFDSMISTELDRSRSDYAANLQAVRERSAEFANAFAEAERAVRERPATGLEAIAQAYEQWLSGDGLSGLLGRITDLFRATPPTATDSIPGAIVGETVDRPRASIEIQEVIIDLTPPATEEGAPGGAPMPMSPELMYAQLLAYQRELAQRGSDDSTLLPA